MSCPLPLIFFAGQTKILLYRGVELEDRRTFGGIVGMALEIYGRRFGTFFAIALIGQFLWVLGDVFRSEVSWTGPIPSNPVMVAAFLMAYLIGLIPYTMQVPALLSAVWVSFFGDELTLGQAFDRASVRLTWEAFWVRLIALWLTVGGLLLGFVPGIIFGVWFFLADVVVVLEGKRDLNALKRSQWLISGDWWKTMSVILVGLFTAALLVGLVGLAVDGIFGVVLSRLMGIVVTPFVFALQVVLYRDLMARKEHGRGVVLEGGRAPDGAHP